MKRIFLAALFCLFANAGFSKVFRVGFADVPPIAGQDYATFFLAYPNLNNGDTVYVFPGSNLGTGWPFSVGRFQVTIAKRLVIISKGEWLDSSATPRGNFDLQATRGTGNFSDSRIIFNTGSSGSVLMGFNGTGEIVDIRTSRITVKRNYNLIVNFGDANVDSLVIEGNYRVHIDGNSNLSNNYTNTIIRNNFIYRFLLPSKTYTGVIENNTMAWDGTTAANGGDATLSYFSGNSNTNNINFANGTWLVQNNLFISLWTVSAASNRNIFFINGAQNSIFNYNVALESFTTTSWPGTGVGNIFINPAEAASIFEGFPATGTRSADNRYMLKANSPAKAGSALRPAATIDAGMFGGNHPYKLSMIPSIPTIYKIESPEGNTVNGPTLRIDIKTRSNN